MRAFLNAVLAFIGVPSLTDEEFEALTLESTDDAAEVYAALSQVLIARESVSAAHDRLVFYYQAMGVEVTPAPLAKSNILIGGGME